jgi:hypothetical protein
MVFSTRGKLAVANVSAVATAFVCAVAHREQQTAKPCHTQRTHRIVKEQREPRGSERSLRVRFNGVGKRLRQDAVATRW